MGLNLDMALRLAKSVTSNTISSAGKIGDNTLTFDSAGLLPGTASIGDTAITQDDSGREYIFNGNGWYWVRGQLKALSATVTDHTQCIDHHGGLSYNYDTHELRISSHTTGTFGAGNVHTGRSDCNGEPQGIIVVHTLEPAIGWRKSDYSTFSGTATMDGRNGTNTINFSFDLSNTGTSSFTNFNVTDTGSGAATYTFDVSGTYE